MMHVTFWGWRQTKKPTFRADLMNLIGAGTPGEISELALAHAQAMARTFTAMTLCRHRNRPVTFTTPQVEAFLRAGNNLALVDKIWNQALIGG